MDDGARVLFGLQQEQELDEDDEQELVQELVEAPLHSEHSQEEDEELDPQHEEQSGSVWHEVFFDSLDFFELGAQDLGRHDVGAQDLVPQIVLLHDRLLWEDEEEVHCAHESQEQDEEETEELLDEQEQGIVLQVHLTLVTQVVALLDGAFVEGTLVERWLVGGLVDGTLERWLVALVVVTLVVWWLVGLQLVGALVEALVVGRHLVDLTVR